jgi:hypothetical protein
VNPEIAAVVELHDRRTGEAKEIVEFIHEGRKYG